MDTSLLPEFRPAPPPLRHLFPSLSIGDEFNLWQLNILFNLLPQQTLPSVVRALKSKGAQLALCHELSLRVKQNRSLLEHDQFDLVVRLMNSALQVCCLEFVLLVRDKVTIFGGVISQFED